MPKKQADRPPPLVLALVMADAVQRHPVTGKWSIFGAFDTITAPTFPCQHAAVAAYVSLTGGRGAVPVKMRLIDVDETRPPVFEMDSVLRFADPMAWVETSFVCVGPIFPVHPTNACFVW